MLSLCCTCCGPNIQVLYVLPHLKWLFFLMKTDYVLCKAELEFCNLDKFSLSSVKVILICVFYLWFLYFSSYNFLKLYLDLLAVLYLQSSFKWKPEKCYNIPNINVTWNGNKQWKVKGPVMCYRLSWSQQLKKKAVDCCLLRCVCSMIQPKILQHLIPRNLFRI
jgi:hypothetical protein